MLSGFELYPRWVPLTNSLIYNLLVLICRRIKNVPIIINTLKPQVWTEMHPVYTLGQLVDV